MKTLLITQARLGSTRLPGKVLKEIDGEPMLKLHLDRLGKCKNVSKIIVATTDTEEDEKIVRLAEEWGYESFRGSEEDVLDRFYQAAKLCQPEWIVRVTSDCPLLDPELVDEIIEYAYEHEADYVCNSIESPYPDGQDVEVFTFDALEKAWNEAEKRSEREHVTPYIWKNADFMGGTVFGGLKFPAKGDYGQLRMSVDELEDLKLIRKLIHDLGKNKTWKEYSDYMVEKNLTAMNKKYKRNEGYYKSLQKDQTGTGQELYKKAKSLIPGGTMLLSKRPEMFLPEQWPSYFSRAKGCEIWDLDGNRYIDMSIMGIGTNILGYGHDEVDDAVRSVIDKGNMSTFNCPEEVRLAEKLVEMHPWADMVRFARTGGEANAIAIRIARAASGKDKVAICGYHGWHDWYLAANLAGDDNLEGHLLPGLDPNGVPAGLKNSVYPFNYNQFEELETIVKNHDIGIIKMEVSRNIEPEDGFLEKVRELATRENIILIFDECTSGFRRSFGGLHKYYGVEPDMALFGKALGNGYAITAAIGRREIMEAAQKTFISSTFWTERIGPAAALKTLEVMEREKTWETITDTGKRIGEEWKKMAGKYDLSLQVFGLPAIISFSFDSENAHAYKTLITQEMLKKGILAVTSVYVSTAHTDEYLDIYFSKLGDVFEMIAECENGRDISELLEGPVCHSGFKRLN